MQTNKNTLAGATIGVFLAASCAQLGLLQMYPKTDARLESLARDLQEILNAQAKDKPIDQEKLLLQIKKVLNQYSIGKKRKLIINSMWFALSVVQWCCALPAVVCVYRFKLVDLIKLNNEI